MSLEQRIRNLSVPTEPSRAVQDIMAARTAARAATVPPAAALGEEDGAPAHLRGLLGEVIEGLEESIVGLSRFVHAHPEVGYEEERAVAEVARVLREAGIEPEVGVYGMPTALRAQIGEEGPLSAGTIAILAEYDALPGIGHGCGHNVMCANSVGAFLALAEMERREPGSLPGRVVLQTTPAEECDTAKERMALAGMLDGVDAAVQTHSYAHDVVSQVWLGVRRVRVVFTGVAAHASSQPFMGRNALDAATLALTGLGLLRQQLTPWDRVHAVMVDGGQVANIIPERTELSIFVRSAHIETLRDVLMRVEDVMRGAALMTGTGVEIIVPDYSNELPVRDNPTLGRAWVRSQRARGRDPLPAGVLPETVAAGTDFGNVSVRVPGIHPLIQVTDGGDVALHTVEMARAAGARTGERAAVDGAFGLASVALDWLWDENVRRAAREDFEAAGGVVDVESLWRR